MKRQRNLTCKNGEFGLDKDSNIINSGCKELRRPGSAWCQECSDEHKELQHD